MVDIVVDQKPMPQNRVDPDVKIPDSVRRRSAAVDALYQQPQPAPQAPPVATTQPAAPAPQPAATESPSPPEPPQPPAADPNQLTLPGVEPPPVPPPPSPVAKVVSGSEENQL